MLESVKNGDIVTNGDEKQLHEVEYAESSPPKDGNLLLSADYKRRFAYLT